MILSPIARRRVKMLLTILWGGFLAYGPLATFVVVYFRWPLSAVSKNSLLYIGAPALVSALCTLVTAIVYLFLSPKKALLLLLVFALEAALFFPPLNMLVEAKGFANYSNLEAVYVKKHCAPMDFTQDGKTYQFGMCDLKVNNQGLIDFTLAYDTSGDIINYRHLNDADRKSFIAAVRKYFKNDPNEPFEIDGFTPERYYHNFFDVDFTNPGTNGFRGFYVMPPLPKSPYLSLF